MGEIQRPTGVGSPDQWTPVGAANVTLAVQSADNYATHAKRDTSTGTTMFTFNSFRVPGVKSVQSVDFIAEAKRTAAGAVNYFHRAVWGGTSYGNSPAALNEVTQTIRWVNLTNPDTGNPPTLDDVRGRGANALTNSAIRATPGAGEEAQVDEYYRECIPAVRSENRRWLLNKIFRRQRLCQ